MWVVMALNKTLHGSVGDLDAIVNFTEIKDCVGALLVYETREAAEAEAARTPKASVVEVKISD